MTDGEIGIAVGLLGIAVTILAWLDSRRDRDK